MTELICYKCSGPVAPEKAIGTTDGKVVCPRCAKKLGLKVRRVQRLEEVTRMRTREEVTAEIEKLKDHTEGEPNDEPFIQASIDALDWALGNISTAPSGAL